MRNKKSFFLVSSFILWLELCLLGCSSANHVAQAENKEIYNQDEQKKIEKKYDDKMLTSVQTMIDQMSLEEKIGQMLMPSIYKGSITKVTPSIKNAISDYGFGGVIIFKSNVQSIEQTTTLLHDLQTAATESKTKIPLLLGIDQEGGVIVRIKNSCWMPGNMLIGASGNPDYSNQYAQLVGNEIKALGFNVNFAPCADVNCNPSNPIIGLRSFSSNPNLVSKMLRGSLQGYSKVNIISALKHFPGHGDTATDSHYGLPIINKPYDEIKKMELVPFASGVDSGAEMIMTAHIQFPDIENETYRSIANGSNVYLPATLSKKIVTGILREKLKFDGVVITDAMDMGAVTKHFKKLDAAKLAINAGVDILLMACDLSSVDEIRKSFSLISDLAEAVRSGEIPENRINESVKRILVLKYKHGILNWEDDLKNQVSIAKTFVSSLENHNIEWEITKSGITVVKNENSLLPLSVDENNKIGILYPYSTETTSIKYALEYVKEKFSKNPNVTLLSYAGKSFASVSSQISKFDSVVIITELSQPSQFSQFNDRASRFAFVDKVIENQHALGKKVVLISAELPYDIAAYSDADAIVACYGAYEMTTIPGNNASTNYGYGPNLPVAVAAVLGSCKATGKLPVDIFALDEKFNYTNQILYPIGTCAKFNSVY